MLFAGRRGREGRITGFRRLWWWRPLLLVVVAFASLPTICWSTNDDAFTALSTATAFPAVDNEEAPILWEGTRGGEESAESTTTAIVGREGGRPPLSARRILSVPTIYPVPTGLPTLQPTPQPTTLPGAVTKRDHFRSGGEFLGNRKKGPGRDIGRRLGYATTTSTNCAAAGYSTITSASDCSAAASSLGVCHKL